MEMTCKSITMPTGSTLLKSTASSVAWEQSQLLSSSDCRLLCPPTLLMTYFLMLGGAVSGSAMDNPDYVYAFHDDFSSSVLKKEWMTNNYGKWSVQQGRLLGDTMQASIKDGVEIGLYVKSGFTWKDVEVELDLMETGTKNSALGPFLRLSNADHSKTTAWWFEYNPVSTDRCTMRPQGNNKDGGWKYNSKLPTAFTLNTWFHFKYQVIGDRFSQWANDKLVHNNVQVGSEWKIPAGTLGLGCHKSPHNCKTLYDNIKVRFLVTSPPNITLGTFQTGFFSQSSLLGEKNLIADSCKQIHDASLVNDKPRAKNGIYWIKTDLQGSSSVQTYCDIENGGWTLVGKVSGKVGNIYKTWLVSNYNTAALKTPKITKQKEYACIDARRLAVEEASSILLSSGERMDGLGSKWVMWRLPGDREKNLLWNHSVGPSTVNAAVKTPVMVYAWNGNKKVISNTLKETFKLPLNFGGFCIVFEAFSFSILNKIRVVAIKVKKTKQIASSSHLLIKIAKHKHSLVSVSISFFFLQICYQNKFGIMPLGGHGGSYPYASYNTAGNTDNNDYCVAVGVMAKGSTAHGWSQNANGYDSPRSDSDWPNKAYNHQSPHLTVWLK